ncbi:MAG: DinB family protein [Armatimonadota bacterium]|nr:DinB family protein [Armatimonadota bacterium]
MKRFGVAPLDGYHPEIGILLAALLESTREYRRYLEGVSEQAITYQSRPGGHSIGGLLLHMADVELYWVLQIGAGKRIPKNLLPKYACDQYAANWPTPPAMPLADYLVLLDQVRGITLATAKTFHPETLIIRKSWKAELNHRWILAHVIAHDSYHGGQAVLLCDLFGALGKAE